MKRKLLSQAAIYAVFFCLFFAAGNLYAQTLVDSALRYNMPTLPLIQAIQAKQAQLQSDNPSDSSEGSSVNEFSRRSFFLKRNFSGNAPADSDALMPYARTMLSVLTQPNEYCTGSGGNWQCMGPYNQDNTTAGFGGGENQGRANSLWVCPTDTNYILAATYGGLWKTRNAGVSWHNISDGIDLGYSSSTQIPGTMGMISLAVNPLDNNYFCVYLADWWGMGFGVAYSSDTGDHWRYDTSFNRLAGVTFFDAATDIKMMYLPGTQKLFCFISGSSNQSPLILLKPDTASSWQNITPSLGVDSIITDMEFTIASPGKAVFSTNAADGTAHLWTYDASGGTWTNLGLTMPGSGDTITNIDDISLSATDTVYMLIEVKHSHQHSAKTPLTSNNVIVLSTTPLYYMSGTDTVTMGMQYLVVNPLNPQVMYGTLHNGGENFYQSVNEGHDFLYYGGSGGIQGNTHADARYLTIYTPTTSTNGVNDVLFGATDGGIVKKRAGNTAFQSITGDSLCITEFFGMSNMEHEDDLAIGGAQDNGGITYNKNRGVQWAHTVGGDNMLCKFMRNGVRSAFIEEDFPGLDQVDYGSTSETDSWVSPPSDACAPVYWGGCNAIFRPWYIDQNNNIYVGYRTVWKTSPSSISWSPAFPLGQEPISVDSMPKVLDIVTAEPNNDTMYVAYQDGAPADPTGVGNPHGKLFLTYNVNPTTPPISWTNITPAQVRWWQMEDIEIDPQHPNRIWVALGGLIWSDFSTIIPSDYTRNRILYSPDYGNTWIDVSTGLPPLPINKIKFRKGSNDQLYCATGLGVYSCDFSTFDPSATTVDSNVNRSVRWKCFNNGMPACNVTDMELNYCAGKLRVSTMGRGIWQTDLPQIAPKPTDTIYTSTVWNTDQYIDVGLDIKSGATLKISHCTVFMPKYGIIHVEPGAHLICDACTLTNECEQCMWGGVVADGANSTVAINDAADGWVTIDSGSIIENALVGVSNADGTGGFIQVKNSSFIDCDTSVKLTNFVHTSGSTLSVYPCYFANTEFILDNSYIGDAQGLPMLQMVYLNNVAGASFQGCDFLNRDTFATQKGVGVGISSLNAGFNVSAVCLTPTHCMICPCLGMKNSRFCGFLNGIHIADVMGNDFTVSVDHTIFDSVGVGVFTDVQNHVSCTEDSFRVGWGVPVTDVKDGCMQNIGILTQNAYQFRIEANYFEGNPSGSASTVSGWINMGTAVIGSSPHYVDTQMNTVYRNSYDSLSVGVFAFDGNFWLSILCNKFSNNGTDIYVTADNLTTYVYYGGIYWDQGSFTQSAGNTFSNSVNNIINTAMTAAGTPTTISYFYDVANSAEYPAHISTSSVYVTPISSQNSCVPTFGNLGAATAVPLNPLSPVAINAENCAFKPNGSTYFVQPFAPVILDSLGFAAYRFMYSTNKQILSDYLDVLDSLIDFGNTDSLINYIDTVTSTDSLYSTLLTGSPFLSEDAISEATINNNQLTTAQTFQVLQHNPDVLRDPVFFGTMITTYTFSPKQLASLDTSVIDSFTLRSIINDSIHVAIMGMDNASNVIMMALEAPVDPQYPFVDIYDHGVCQDSTSMYYLLDSNATYYYIDSVDTWLQNIGRLWTYYARVGYYNQIPDASNLPQYGIADSIFQSINGIITTSPDYTTYQTMSTVWSVLYGAEQDGRNVTSLNSNEIATLDTFSTPIATDNTGLELIGLITHIITTGPPNILPFPCLEYASKDRKGHTGGNNDGKGSGQASSGRFTPLTLQSQNKQFAAFPNPTNGVVTFTYNVPDAGGDIHIIISNVLGEQVFDAHTGNNAGSFVWDATNLPPGIYIYQAGGNRGIISKGRIVLAK